MKKLTPRMREVLGYLQQGLPAQHGCYGMSEYGGCAKVLQGLYNRGLVDASNNLTKAGREFGLGKS